MHNNYSIASANSLVDKIFVQKFEISVEFKS